MGRKEKWLRAVKRVFNPESKEKESKSHKSKKWEAGKPEDSNPYSSQSLDKAASDAAPLPPAVAHKEEIKLAGNEQSKQSYPVALATAKAADAEVVRLTNSGKSREEAAAIKIQTSFRGYLARRALRALRGLVRLKSLIQGNSIKRQAASTLRCMQTLARVQSQIRSRRIRMSEENQALQQKLLLNGERELEKLKMGEKWDDSLRSKEQIEASLLSKHEAAIRRERAMAYAFSHQWKDSSRSANPLFTDSNNPQWGWSWLERWLAARPWESRSIADNDHSSVNSASFSVSREINKAYACCNTISDRPSPASQKSSRPASRQSPSTPPTKASLLTRKIKSASPKASEAPPEDDSRSIRSLQPEQYRRHSMVGSSVGDDESLASSPADPSYMAPTKSARAKSRFSPAVSDKETSEKGPACSVKKRLSFPVGEKHNMTSPAGARRHSGPPKVGIASVKDISIH